MKVSTTILFIMLICAESSFSANEILISQHPALPQTIAADALPEDPAHLSKNLKQRTNLKQVDESSGIENKQLNMSLKKTEDVLLISTLNGSAPFSFINANGDQTGILTDIWRLWSGKTGKKIAFLPAVTWKESVENLKNGKADIHSGIFYTSDQYEGIRFSQPYYGTEVRLFFPVKHNEISTIAALSEQSVGVIRGGTQELYLEKKTSKFQNFKIRHLETDDLRRQRGENTGIYLQCL